MRTFERTTNIYVFSVIIVLSIGIGFGIVLVPLKFGYIALFPLAFSGLLIVSGTTRNLMLRLRWWHILWLFIFLSGLVFRIRDVGMLEKNPYDFWALYRIGLVSVVGLLLFCRLIFQRTRWYKPLFQGLIGLLTGYTLLSAASTYWSVYPLFTLYKSLEYFVDLALIAAIVASVRDVQEFKTLFDWTWLLTGLLAISVLIGVIVLPEGTIKHGVGLIGIQIKGILPHLAANSVGSIGAILGIVAVTRLLFPTNHKSFYIIVFIIAMFILVLSQSRSPLTGFLVALPLVLFSARRIGIIVLLSLLIVALLSLTSVGDLFWQFFLRGQSPDQFASLTGRVNWWKFGWEAFKERPFTGYGAYAGSRFAVLAGLGRLFTSSIHNTWFEILFGVGPLGIFFVLGAFLGTWVVLLRFVLFEKSIDITSRLAVEAIGVLAVLSVRSIFSSGLVWHPSLTFLLVLGYAEFLRRKNKDYFYITPSGN